MLQPTRLRAESDLTVRGHVAALDGLRGVAVLLVLFHHIWPFAWSIDGYWAFNKLKHVGWIGVDLFFVLSGFLISGILLDSVGKPGWFKNFIARRSLRIFPLYFFFLALAFVLIPDPADRSLWPWFVTYASNLLPLFDGPSTAEHLAITWSLAVEEQFYLLWPWVVLLFGRSLGRAAAIVAALAVACRVAAVASLDNWTVVTNVVTLCRVDSLAIGAALAFAVRRPDFSIDVWRRRTRFVLMVVAPVWVVWLLLGRGRSETAYALGGYTVGALCFAAVLARALDRRRGVLHRVLESRPLIWFGTYSYGLYLYHMMVLHFVDRWRPAHLGTDGTITDPEQYQPLLGSAVADAPLRLLLVVGLTCALAWISFHVVERPFLKLKRWFV